jgi:hypothetical protein
VSPVRYELGFYIPEEGILIVTAVETSYFTTKLLFCIDVRNAYRNTQIYGI